MSNETPKPTIANQNKTLATVKQRSQVAHYWRDIFAFAWKETELLSWRQTLTTLGISAGGFLLQYAIGVRAFYVTLQIISTVLAAYLIVALGSYLWNVVSIPAITHGEVSREAEGLRERLKPQLDITFDEAKPEFIDPTKIADPRGGSWRGKLYRVAVTSHSSSASVRLKIDRAQITARTLPRLHLRITHNPTAKETRLHAGIPEFWDVIEKKDSEREWVGLTETDTTTGVLLRIPCSFTITASCEEGFGVTKLVTLKIKENNDLDVQLSDL